jgi:hypothetical protein
MRCKIAIACLAVVLAGCGYFPKEVYTSAAQCMYIGCETGGPVFYPHEEFSATELPRRWYGVNGKLPSDYPPGSAERKRVRALQIEKLHSMGLDPFGRPL